jgi:hypothetical protein
MILGLVAVLIQAVGCGKDCPAIAKSGLSVRVLSAKSDEAICDAHVVAIQGSYAEALARSELPDCRYVGLVSRPGTFTIETSATGFQASTDGPVTIPTEEECGQVIPQSLTVLLSPQ